MALLAVVTDAPADQATRAKADVVVVVDTSVSMQDPGMDPERTSLLVTKLLADIVPGDLAVVRLLDATRDKGTLPFIETGITEPCEEDPSAQCNVFKLDISAAQEIVRESALLAKVRPAQGDEGFKRDLESHLEQVGQNSHFGLALRCAQGVFDQHRARGDEPMVPKTVIWLSDGRAEMPNLVRQAAAELKADGIAIEAIVFGRGKTALARQVSKHVQQVSGPAQLMKAFSGAFRRTVRAPFEIDNLVASAPGFEIKPNVDEAWVVFYGDPTLTEASLEGPTGIVPADDAVDQLPSAGAYRVAYLNRPSPGHWRVRAVGGGPELAYAVVQRSALTPALAEPRETMAGTGVVMVATVRAGATGETLTTTDSVPGVEIVALFDGQTVRLTDDGRSADAVAGDGRFSAMVTFFNVGDVAVKLDLRSPLGNRSTESRVLVSGQFSYPGEAVEIDLGRLQVASEACRPLMFDAQHVGPIAFELRRLRRLPSGHRLQVRLPKGLLTPGSDPITAQPADRFEVCLLTAEDVASSTGAGETWLELQVAGSDLAEHRVPIQLSWQVEGLSFWQRWGWLILSVLAALVVAFIVGGFVIPKRFVRSLAVAFVPERDDLDEQSPQPVRQWKGVGIGFYRNARACLQADFRLTGRPSGALAILQARGRSTQVVPGKGSRLFRETLDGDWEVVRPEGHRARGGDVFRVGDQGPYFRISRGRG